MNVKFFNLFEIILKYCIDNVKLLGMKFLVVLKSINCLKLYYI